MLLKPMQNPIIFCILTRNSHSLREGRTQPYNVKSRVCSEQRGKHQFFLAGKTQLILSPYLILSEQLIETQLICLVSATVF